MIQALETFKVRMTGDIEQVRKHDFIRYINDTSSKYKPEIDTTNHDTNMAIIGLVDVLEPFYKSITYFPELQTVAIIKYGERNVFTWTMPIENERKIFRTLYAPHNLGILKYTKRIIVVINSLSMHLYEKYQKALKYLTWDGQQIDFVFIARELPVENLDALAGASPRAGIYHIDCENMSTYDGPGFMETL